MDTLLNYVECRYIYEEDILGYTYWFFNELVYHLSAMIDEVTISPVVVIDVMHT